MTDDEQTVLIVFACVGGSLFIGLLLFYAAFQRLPHWLRNLFNAPPIFSCQAADTKVATYNQVVTGRVLGVSCVPLLIIVALTIMVVVGKNHIRVSDWDGIMPIVDCGAEVAKEQVAMGVVLARGVRAADPEQADRAELAFDLQVRRTNDACDALVGPALARARSARTFAAAHTGYRAVQEQLRAASIVRVTEAIEEHDRRQISAFTALMMVWGGSADCEATTLSHRVANYADIMAWNAISLARKVFVAVTDSANVFYATLVGYPSADIESRRQVILENIIPQYKQRAGAGGSFIRSPGSPEQEAGNFTAAIDALQTGFAAATAHYMRDSFNDHNEDVDVFVGLCAAAIALTTVTIIGCVALVMRYSAEISGDISIRANFEDCAESKQRLQTYVKHISALQVENVQRSDSVVEACFVDLIEKLRELKPFVSHNLFEGNLEEEEDGELYAGGRTALHPVRSEIGMHFTSCAVLGVSTNVFDELPKADMQDRLDDISNDYSAYIQIVTAAAAQTGGVVHHIGNGVIFCTWNVSITCDMPSDRAVRAAFTLHEEFTRASNAEDVFKIIPDDPVQISVCTGDVMAGLVKAFPLRNIMIGNAPLLAERMKEMNTLHSADILIDHATHRAVHDQYYTKPVYILPNGNIVYQAKDAPPHRDDRSMKDYLECFTHMKKGKLDDAKDSLRAHLAKQQFKNDACAKFLLGRLSHMHAIQNGKVDAADLPMMM